MKRSSASVSTTQSPAKHTRPFSGEAKCACGNVAYYWRESAAQCGNCTRNKSREKLARNPQAADVRAEKMRAHMATVEAARTPGNGQVRVQRMLMMRSPPQEDGWLLVFPNFKHGGRTDGLGMPQLSPKSLGPIEHGQPGLPVARNLENFHQFAKFWHMDVGADEMPTQQALEERRQAYESDVPARHRHPREELARLGNPNQPLFSLYYATDGSPRKYNYLQCRYFYCHFYQRLVVLTPQYSDLRRRLSDGYHLTLVGYDGRPVEPTAEALWEAYLYTERPFGHELVLFSMLVLGDETERYPWNRYYRENAQLYAGVIDNAQ